jgi:hypothetical protein
MKPIRLAWLNLIRHRFSTVTTIVAITLSVGVSGILFHLYRLSTSRFNSISLIGDAVVGAKANSLDILLSSLNFEGDFPGFVPHKLYESLRERQSVKFEDGAQTQGLSFSRVFPFTFVGRLDPVGPNGRVGSARLVATEPQFIGAAPLAVGQWDDSAGSCIAGAAAARARGWKVGQTIELDTWLGPHIPSRRISLKLSGIMVALDSSWDDAVFTNPETQKQILSTAAADLPSIWNTDVVHYMVFQMAENQFPPLRDLVNSRTVSQAIDVSAELNRLRDLTGTGRELGLSIALLIIALGALCVVAMLVARFDALGVQIAVLRASGFSLSEIASWLLWEGFFLGLTSVVLGTVLQLAAIPVLEIVLAQWIPVQSGTGAHALFSESLAIVGSTAFVATLFAAFIPFLRLSRQNIHDALRGI